MGRVGGNVRPACRSVPAMLSACQSLEQVIGKVGVVGMGGGGGRLVAAVGWGHARMHTLSGRQGFLSLPCLQSPTLILQGTRYAARAQKAEESAYIQYAPAVKSHASAMRYSAVRTKSA